MLSAQRQAAKPAAGTSKDATSARSRAPVALARLASPAGCACGGGCPRCRRAGSGGRSAARREAPPIVHEVMRAAGRPLEPQVRATMEERFGEDFGSVRLHTDPRAAQSARAVRALAYTVGPHIAFAAGGYAPHTDAGRRTLVHELTHVVQQRRAVASSRLEIGPPDDLAEREAHRVAERAVSGATGSPSEPTLLSSPQTLQRTCSEHSDEAFYQSASNYCADTGFSGSLHPGQTCYREVPVRSSYWDCPPGDQVCFDEDGGCHDSFDEVSTVESKNDDGSCNLHSYCFLGHAGRDIIPGAPGIKQTLCLARCSGMSGLAKFFCAQHCFRAE